MSIEYDDDDSAANGDDGPDDLMLSYHGNDHYNSVHRLGAGNAKINKKHPTFLSSSKDEKRSNDVPNPAKNTNANNTNVEDYDHCKAPEENDGNQRNGAVNSNRSNIRPPTRGSNCPCGSGNKYKKCCMAEEKAKRRMTKLTVENRRYSKDHKSEEKDDNDDEFIGKFRVIPI